MLIYAGEVKLRCMKVKTRANIDAEMADTKLKDHLNTIKRVCLGKKKRPKQKISSGAALRQNLLNNIRNQNTGESVLEENKSTSVAGQNNVKSKQMSKDPNND